MNNNTVIAVSNLVKELPVSSGDNLLILDKINLHIEQGESIAITGASGSGKTTLLGLLAGLDVSTKGDVLLLNQSLSEMDEDQRASLRRGQVGFVFQSFHLMDNLTALENVMLPLELDSTSNLTFTEIRQQALEALEQVGLADRISHLPTQLSGGEQQRVALARAFVTNPVILFADEPTGNLDRNTGEEIISLLFSMQQKSNTTLVMVTHDDDLAGRCEKHYRIQDGQLKQS
ncbi:MAG: ATP-binding cassette domain-containing protein [Cocleimonas sp.]